MPGSKPTNRAASASVSRCTNRAAGLSIKRARIAHDDAALAPLSLAVVPDHRRRNLPRERLAVARRIVEHRTHRQVGPIQCRRFLAVLAQERPVDAGTGRR